MECMRMCREKSDDFLQRRKGKSPGQATITDHSHLRHENKQHTGENNMSSLPMTLYIAMNAYLQNNFTRTVEPDT